MCVIKHGFAPVFDERSRILILGSFPSVKSRQAEFYYGNKQNRFWRIVCGFFGEDVPAAVEDKINFLLRRGVALWDIVDECEISGSDDSSIKNYKTADLSVVLGGCSPELIALNGGKAYEIFKKAYGDIGIEYVKLPSTSPANARCDVAAWRVALATVFGKI